MPAPKIAAVPVQTHASRIAHMRRLIGAAQEEGAGVEELVLRLSTRDSSTLKRHPSVELHEIAFTGGEMRFLGVKIREDGVAEPVVEREG